MTPYLPKEISETDLLLKSTARLLQIYRQVRRQTIAIWNIGICECCGERVGPEDEAKMVLAAWEVWRTYQDRIKAILDTRDNVIQPYHEKTSQKFEKSARKKLVK